MEKTRRNIQSFSTSPQAEQAIINLKNIHERSTPEEQREQCRRAGIASGQSRRRKSDMRAALTALLTAEVPDSLPDVREQLQAIGVENPTMETAMCFAALSKAVRGDIEACRWIRDTSGNKIGELLTVNRTSDVPFSKTDLSTLSNEELQQLISDCSDDDSVQ